MNPLTNMKNVLKLSEQELRSSMKTSWHDQYKHSAWIFVGGLPFDLTEGDIICVFSQYGEVVNINLVRDKGTGKSRGFCFICYEDQRSTNLAVDNFNGIKLLNRTIRVDHCEGYKAPKDDKMDEETRQLHSEGCAPGSKFGNLPQLPKSGSNGGLDKGPNLPPMESLLKIKTENEDTSNKSKEKKTKREKNTKKTKDAVKKLFKKKKEEDSSSSSSSSSDDSSSESDDVNSKKTKKNLKRKNQRKSSDSSEDSQEESNTKKKRTENKKKSKSKNESSSNEDSSDEIKKSSQKKYQRHSSSHNEVENKPSVGKQKGRTEETRPIKSRSNDKFDYSENSRTDFKAKTFERKGDTHRLYEDKNYGRDTHGHYKGQKDFDKGRRSERGREEKWRYENERKGNDGRREEREKEVEKGADDYRKYEVERRYRDERRTDRKEDHYRKQSSSRPY